MIFVSDHGLGTVVLALTTFAIVVPNFTVLVPWVAPKPVPVMVRVGPAAATVFAESDEMHGPVAGQFAVKMAGGLFVPPTDTITFVGPVATSGTVTVIDVSDHGGVVATAAVVVPNFTVLVPWVAPKPVPVMVTGVVRGPESGERSLMHGPVAGQFTVKVAGELSLPLADTTTGIGPTGTLGGTVTTIAEADQEEAFTVADPNFTLPDVP
jgi:hypothetical protein